MKKLFALTLVAGFALASCSKEVTCTCTAKDADGNELSSASATSKGKKNDLVDACEGGSASVGGITTTCVATY